MKVLDYVIQNEIQHFYCKTATEIILIHTHKSRAGNQTKISEVFGRENLCHLENWNEYYSFKSFADKEIVKIENHFTSTPIFYVNFTNTDWQKEIKNLFKENKRDYNYYIDLIRRRTR